LILRKYIHEFISAVSNKIISSQFDLFLQLKRKATHDTIEYIEKNMANAMILLSKEKNLEFSLNQTHVDGAFLEFGVATGKSIRFISKHVPHGKMVYGFDCFTGMPSNWTGTTVIKGQFKQEQIPKVPTNVTLVPGYFGEILPKFLDEHKEVISFMYIDSDLYSSAKTILEALTDRIVQGTIIVFDEYFNYPNWKNHEFKAFQEFVTKNNIAYEYLSFTNQESVTVKIITERNMHDE